MSRAPGELAYRALLRLHPARFRRRYEEDLVACYRDAWREEARGHGPAALAAFWARQAYGVVATAWHQRMPADAAGRDRSKAREGSMGGRAWSHWVDDRLQDARFTGRRLRRDPRFAAAVLLTLGLSIGAATAIYSVVYGILLQPLPYPHADRIYQVGQDGDGGSYWLSAPNYIDMKKGLTSFMSMAAYTPDGANMVVDGEPARVDVAETDADFFATLGVAPVLGRTFTEKEQAADAPVAVVSHDLWVQRMGARPDAIGGTLVLGGVSREVIGVLPAEPMVPAGAQVWTPLSLTSPDWRTRRGISWIKVIGRLRADAHVAAARSEAEALSKTLRSSYPQDNEKLTIGFESLEKATVGDIRTELGILMAAVCLVLLVAAINVGGLVLARAGARHREVSVRMALGGGRRRLAAQILTEALVYAGLGGALGLLFARVGLAGLLAAAPPGTPRLDAVGMGAQTLVFAVAAALAAAALLGLVTLIGLRSRPDVLHGTRAGQGRAGARTRAGLVVAQVALALALLFGAGLLGKSFLLTQQVDLGFRSGNVLVGGLPIDDAGFHSARAREEYYQAILDRTKALPGVLDAALTSSAPYTGFGVVFGFDLPDRPAATGERRLARFRVVTPEVFRTLGLPLLRGRTFRPREGSESARPGTVVSEDLVRRYYGGESPLGRTLVTAGDSFTIVGVVPTIRDVSPRQASPFPFVYVPVMPSKQQSMTLVVRTAGDPAALAVPLRHAVHEVAPEQPVTPLRPMTELVADSAARPRFTLELLGFFAAASLLLAGVGLYGVLAYAVGLRTREIGVRMALGAPPSRVRSLVVRQWSMLVAVGCVIGTGLAVWGGHLLEGVLFQVEPSDPLVLATVAAVLVSVAMFAAWIPVRRATRIAPVQALRNE